MCDNPCSVCRSIIYRKFGWLMKYIYECFSFVLMRVWWIIEKLITLQTLLMGFGLVVGAVSAAIMFQWVRSKVRKWSAAAKKKTDGDVMRYIRGDFLDPNSCQVEWGWSEPMEVGHAVSFHVKFYTQSGQPYPISAEDDIAVTITSNEAGADSVVPVMTFASAEQNNDFDDINLVKVSFTVTKSGTYEIIVTQNEEGIKGSPFTKSFIPGVLSPEHSVLTRTTHALLSVVTMTIEKNRRLIIDARDEFDNKCAVRLNRNDLENKFDLQVREAADLSQCPAFIWNIRPGTDGKALFLDVTMFQKGCFKALLTYDDVEVQNGDFEILVLNCEDADEVHDHVNKRDLNVWFECRLLSEGDFEVDDSKDEPIEGPSVKRSRIKSSSHMFVYSSLKSSLKRSKSSISTTSQSKPRKVFCYLTPKQLIIKEYYFRIFPKRLYTFRVSPITRIVCSHDDENTGLPTFQIQDGVQNRLLLGCAKRNVLVATFIGIIYSNMGGQASTFEEKVSHFYKELRRHNKRDTERPGSTELTVDRANILQSSYQATRRFSDEQWRLPFTVTFQNELGLDWGGVGREWCQVLTKALFEAKSEDSKSGGSGLFKSMKEDSQALVLPNSSSVSGFKLKYYEFAGKIVGKCLLESSGGGMHIRLVSARFARSFLAQIIGLPITYAYFGSDDRELFATKVKYVLENDVDDMALTFSEEIYSNRGELAQEINLIPNGSNISVTNENKRNYLNRLAQYRLSESIRPEIEQFIKGLTSLVPDSLLSVFDENELELIMCGSSNISLEDMKKHSVYGSLPNYVCEWFWAVLSSFTQDDFARLLQFTTGCAQLPPEGFSALQPSFEITTADYHDKGSLPTAHTCFNRLCLPQYDSYEEMRRMLKIAITEGATGFGLA